MPSIKNRSQLQTNIGSLYKIFAVSINKILQGTLPQGMFIGDDGVFNISLFVDNNPTMSALKFEIEFVEESASFKQEEEEKDFGTMYKQTVQCIVAKDYYERTAIFKDMEYDRFLVFAFDNNYQVNIIGEFLIDLDNNGAKVKVSKEVGEGYDSLNHRKIIFYCEATQPAANLGESGNSYFGVPNQNALV